METDSVLDTWFLDKMQIFVNEFQAEKDKVISLETQLKQQQDFIDNISIEKQNVLKKINEFVDASKADLATKAPFLKDTEDFQLLAETWKKNSDMNYTIGLQYHYEKIDALEDVKAVESWKEHFRKENEVLKSKISDLEVKLTVSKLEKSINSVVFNLEKRVQDQAESFKNLQAENDELSANLLKSESNEIVLQKKISNLENDLQTHFKYFEDEKLKLPSRVLQNRFDDLKHELEVKNTIFFSKEKRFLKIIDNLQTYNSSLQKDLDLLTAKTKTTSKEPSLASKVSVQNVSTQTESPNPSPSTHQHSTVNVPKKIYSSKSSKPSVKKVSQFTTYSLHKAKKYSEKPHSSGTFTYSSFLSFSDNSLFISKARTQMKTRECKFSSKASSSSSPTKSFKYSFSKLFDFAPKPLHPLVQKVNDFVVKNPFKFKTPSSFKSNWQRKDFQSTLVPRKLFQKETPSLISRWNAISIHQIDSTYLYSKASKTIGPILKWVPKVVSK